MPPQADEWIRRARDIALVLIGAGIALHETLIAATAEPVLIGFAGTLLLSPAFLRSDRARRQRDHCD